MKFLVDAHLPEALCRWLSQKGHDALHTRTLADGNRTQDEFINNLSIQEQRVGVSKDSDFYYSHILRGMPWKLILVRTGNTGIKDLIDIFTNNHDQIVSALAENDLLELDRTQVRVVR